MRGKDRQKPGMVKVAYVRICVILFYGMVICESVSSHKNRGIEMDYCEPVNVYPLMDEDKENEYYCTLTVLSNNACIYEMDVSKVGKHCKNMNCRYFKSIKKNTHYINADYLD